MDLDVVIDMDEANAPRIGPETAFSDARRRTEIYLAPFGDAAILFAAVFTATQPRCISRMAGGIGRGTFGKQRSPTFADVGRRPQIDTSPFVVAPIRSLCSSHYIKPSQVVEPSKTLSMPATKSF